MKRSIHRIMLFVLVAAITLPIGLVAYSETGKVKQPPIAPAATQETQLNEADVLISDEIQNLIRQSDPLNAEKNIANYKSMLVALNVHEKFKNEIERLITEGHKLPDILIAYEFLYEEYGEMHELEILVKQKEAGAQWSEIWTTYHQQNPEFIPRSFDSSYLQKHLKLPGISADDIMIADTVSQKTAATFDELMEYRIGGMIWKEINAQYNVLNSQSRLPRLPAAQEQINRLVQESGFTEQQVVKALVIAYKLNMSGEEIIEKVTKGYSKEQIYAEYYEKKYY